MEKSGKIWSVAYVSKPQVTIVQRGFTFFFSIELYAVGFNTKRGYGNLKLYWCVS